MAKSWVEVCCLGVEEGRRGELGRSQQQLFESGDGDTRTVLCTLGAVHGDAVLDGRQSLACGER